MRIESDVKLDFKDVLIRPKRSTLNSRNAVDVDRAFRFLHTGSEWSGFPLIAANMDVTGTMAMARALGQRGALTALHKHYPEDELAKFFAGEDQRFRHVAGDDVARHDHRSGILVAHPSDDVEKPLRVAVGDVETEQARLRALAHRRELGEVGLACPERIEGVNAVLAGEEFR